MEPFLQGRLESHQTAHRQPRCAVGLLRSAMGKEWIDRLVEGQWRRTLRNLGTHLRRLDADRRTDVRPSERVDLCRAEHDESRLDSLSAGPEQLWSGRRIRPEP